MKVVFDADIRRFIVSRIYQCFRSWDTLIFKSRDILSLFHYYDILLVSLFILIICAYCENGGGGTRIALFKFMLLGYLHCLNITMYKLKV